MKQMEIKNSGIAWLKIEYKYISVEFGAVRSSRSMVPFVVTSRPIILCTTTRV